ncbi:1848_t:CDS:1 [Paraglomus occultum]|uniref:1848_t:CDS:1 n=1 Tax=Paraglomus occultum TaxID=144539 RepID=A0A9N9CUK8_9GLOM|nr:1848_t:CDS:1 [Paraglomus occultum]
METWKQRIQTCESIQRLSSILGDLRFNKTDQINTVLQSSLRKQIFFNYGYDTLASIEDSYFLGLFETHLSTRGNLTTLMNSSLELQDHPVNEIIERHYQRAIENVKTYCETKCYELKLALLRHYFLLPIGSANHVQNFLKRIERFFTDTYVNTIHTLRGTARIQLTGQQIQKVILLPEVVTTRFSDHTTQILEAFYKQNARPKRSDKVKLAEETGLSIEQIETWFNNKRSRTPKEDTGLCEKQVRQFILEMEIDWIEELKLVENNSLASEDTRCIDNVDHGYVIEIPPSPELSGSIEVDNQSPSSGTRSTSKLVSRSKFTKNARKMASPYATSRPRKGKSTGICSVRMKTPTVENLPENGRAGPASQIGSINATLIASSSSANITPSPSNLKVRVSLNKATARARAQPYSCIPPKRLRKAKYPPTDNGHASNTSAPAIHMANDSYEQIYTEGFLHNMTPSTDNESYFTESLDEAFDRNNQFLPIMEPEYNLTFLAEQYYNGLSSEQLASENALILSPVSVLDHQQQCLRNVDQTIGLFDVQETEIYDHNVNYQLSNDASDMNLQSLSSSFLPSDCFQAYNQFTCEGFDDESSSTQSKSTQSDIDYPLDETFLFDSSNQEAEFPEPYFIDTVLANNGEFSSFTPYEGLLGFGCMNNDVNFSTDETLNTTLQHNISGSESSPWVILTDDD